MRFVKCVALIAITLYPSILFSQSVSNKQLWLLRELIYDVSFRSDSAGLTQALDRLNALDVTQHDLKYKNYWLAFGHWQLSLFTDRSKMETNLDRAIAYTGSATETDSGFADAYALQALCLSPLFRLRPNEIRQLASLQNALVKKALQLAPENPRVRLAVGMNTFYKPEAYGGSQEKGLAHVHKCIEFSPAHRVVGVEPDWGLAIGHAWLASLLQVKKEPDPELARTHYLRSLEIRPDFVWVRDVALPGLK